MSMQRIIDVMSKSQELMMEANFNLLHEERHFLDTTQVAFEERVTNNKWQSWTTMITGAGSGCLKIASGLFSENVKPFLEAASSFFNQAGEMYQQRLRGHEIKAEATLSRSQRDTQFTQEIMRNNHSLQERLSNTVSSMQSTKSQQSGG